MIDPKDQQRSLDYFEQNHHYYLQQLKYLVSIPSVSFTGFDQKTVSQCGQEVLKLFGELGLENVQAIQGEHADRPYIYGEWIKAPGQPTVLLYGHYDVQPPGQIEKWDSKPFDLTERKGRLYGRGSADDKGGLMANLAAVHSILKATGSLPVNIKVLAEGEEECGSAGLDVFIQRHKSLIQADVIIITDAENFNLETPGLTVSLRGLVSISLEIKSLQQPVHSGLLGGPLPDAAMAMAKILSTFVDAKGDLQIPEILKMVKPVPEDERAALHQLPFDQQKFKKQVGVLDSTSLRCEPQETLEHLWFKPSFTVNCVQASSQKQAGNIIVASAWARIGLRTVPNMDGTKVLDLLKKHVQQQNVFGFKVDIKDETVGQWWKTKTDHWSFLTMEESLAKGWGRPAVKIGCGASIPFVQTLTEALGGVPALLIGVCDPLTFAHSENESLSVQVWKNSVRSVIYFLTQIKANKN